MKLLKASLCGSDRSVQDVAEAFSWPTTTISIHVENAVTDIGKIMRAIYEKN